MTKEELFAIAENKHEFKMSYYMDEGFKIFKKNIGGFVGIVVVNFVINFILGKIPLAGQLLSYFVGALISAGMISVCRKIRNGEETQFNDFFEVFKNPGQFLLLLLLQLLMLLLVAIPAIAAIFAKFYQIFTKGEIPPLDTLFTIIPMMFLVLLPVLFLAMCYIFSFHIFMFLNQDTWTAMEASRKVVMKNWLSMLVFLFLLGMLLILITIFTFGLGCLVMLPFTSASIYMAFEDIFKPTMNTFDTKIEAFGSLQKDLNTEAEAKNI